MRTARTPRFLSSMPHARPVGPAPTMTTSTESTLEHPFDVGVHVGQSFRQCGGILAAGLRHIGSPAALAADSRRHGAREFSGVDLGYQVLGDAADDRHI